MSIPASAFSATAAPPGRALPLAGPPPDLDFFHPAVWTWFTTRLGDPHPAQRQAWPLIQARRPTLIAAPTGSGKTLAAFLALLNEYLLRSLEGALEDRVLAVYVSPLKALSADIEKNLQEPLQGIAETLFRDFLQNVTIRTALRTGDTPASERQALHKKPPHILITTPESLYLLLTSERGRKMLDGVETVLLDEIHALCGNRRGAHLALTLERLEALCGRPLLRVGLSATQKPIETVAAFLVGNRERTAGRAPAAADSSLAPLGSLPDGDPVAMAVPGPGLPAGAGGPDGDLGPACHIVDAGHRRKMDLALLLPETPLGPFMPNEVWEEVYAKILEAAEPHRTTLVFVNTRRACERVAHRLKEALGDRVSAHHGSMSRERRLKAESDLKAGRLSILVATASLELGIDIGEVDLVLQLGTPKSIAAFLQRVGRSGHHLKGLPKGRLVPLSRDELVEAAALLEALSLGELDALRNLDRPLDILCQQVVAEAACREWDVEELYRVFRNAFPYRGLGREEFLEIVTMLAEGFTTRRGRRGAHLHYDRVNGKVKGRTGARLKALLNGGSIPDTFDYEVRLQDGNVLLGSVNEDFAIESMKGDVFLLGNAPWRILRLEEGKLWVADAKGEMPSIPFWLGEAPGRTPELSEAVSRLRSRVQEKLLQGEEALAPGSPARAYLEDELGLIPAASLQILRYLGHAYHSLGALPTQGSLVLERFFDEAGDMHIVLHSPFGSRLNRAWGLALRKRFCRKFNFELQAAATEEAIILSLGATHSFPLEEVFHYLHSSSVRHILVQALLDAPMFELRWRWNASRALAISRRDGGRRTPPQLQRMAAEDLVALIFPDQRACFENIQGEREVPDHPLVRQTIDDCLFEAMDIERLEALLRRIESGDLKYTVRDGLEPSPLAQEIIAAKPYAFLDDTPLEERRTRALKVEFDLPDRPSLAAPREGLDGEAILEVQREALPRMRNADECHEALFLGGYLLEAEMALMAGAAGGAAATGATSATGGGGVGIGEGGGGGRTGAGSRTEDAPDRVGAFLGILAEANRVGAFRYADHQVWVASERLAEFRLAFPEAEALLLPHLPERFESRGMGEDGALGTGEAVEKARLELARSRLEWMGPVTAMELSGFGPEAPPSADFTAALHALEVEGFVLRGRFRPAGPGPASGGAEAALEWCERRLLHRISRRSLHRRRRESEVVPREVFMRFLCRWQGVRPLDPAPEAPALAPHPASAPAWQGLQDTLGKLEGYCAPLAAWEDEILPARLPHYEESHLDFLCLTGAVAWARLPLCDEPGVTGAEPPAASLSAVANLPPAANPPASAPEVTPAMEPPSGPRPKKAGPLRSTPILFLPREAMPVWLGWGGQVPGLAPGSPATVRGPVSGPAGAAPAPRASSGPDLSPGPVGTAPGPASAPLSGLGSYAAQVFEILLRDGASFTDDLPRKTRLLPSQVKDGLSELVALGRVRCDGFQGLRALLGSHPSAAKAAALRLGRGFGRFPSPVSYMLPFRAPAPAFASPASAFGSPGFGSGTPARGLASSGPALGLSHAGRWSVVMEAGPPPGGDPPNGEAANGDPANGPPPGRRHPKAPGGPGGDTLDRDLHIASALLRRYGVFFRQLGEREGRIPPWHRLLRALRLLEMRGEVRGGRFVEGPYGEQFALPEALEMLKTAGEEGHALADTGEEGDGRGGGRLKEQKPPSPSEGGLAPSDARGEGGRGVGRLSNWFRVSAVDPLNLQGILFDGPRLPSLRKNRLLLRDGRPFAGLESGSPVFYAAAEKASPETRAIALAALRR